MDRYNFKSAEDKWQKIWEKSKPYKTNVNHKKKKFYCLEMFPYPSGNIQCASPNGLGFIWYACRKCC